jgi:hypothetical protein
LLALRQGVEEKTVSWLDRGGIMFPESALIIVSRAAQGEKRGFGCNKSAAAQSIFNHTRVWSSKLILA